MGLRQLAALIHDFDDEVCRIGGEDSMFNAKRDGKRKTYVESQLHELAHMVTLGIYPEHAVCIAEEVANEVGEYLSRKPEEADRNECLTCAVEVTVARQFGLCFPVRRLATFAQQMMRTLSEEQTLQCIQRKMRTRECQRFAKRLVRLLESVRG